MCYQIFDLFVVDVELGLVAECITIREFGFVAGGV